MGYLIAIDEGTTSTRSSLYDLNTRRIENIVCYPIKQYYPQPGYVEEDAEEIYLKTVQAVNNNIDKVGVGEVLGIGITNQRETVVAWDKTTGKPLYNAIVWQCRRTADYCQKLKEDYGEEIHSKTGLVVDAYFSASKIRWLIDNVPEVRKQLDNKNLCVGTIDSYLVYRMTNGQSFVTDCTNASRTMLYNINTLQWDEDLLKIMDIPLDILPKVVTCDQKVGYYQCKGQNIAIAGIAGDQQSALFGQGCYQEGSGKITYGTGLFMLYNTGKKSVISKNGLLTTIGYAVKGQVCYALEGSVFNAGSSVQWLRDELGFFGKSSDSEELAKSVESTDGVYVVPAFTGLGAPYWNSKAQGIITGITRATTKAHVTRATLESMAYSAKDLADIMQKESGTTLKETRTDGGASQNDFLMQFQSDVLGVVINRPQEIESTSLGAIYLCGIALGLFGIEDVEDLRKVDKIFMPSKDRVLYQEKYLGWQKAIKKCLAFED